MTPVPGRSFSKDPYFPFSKISANSGRPARVLGASALTFPYHPRADPTKKKLDPGIIPGTRNAGHSSPPNPACRLYLYEKPLPTYLARLADVPRSSWGNLEAGTQSIPHFFFVARPAFRVLEHFAVSGPGRKSLEEAPGTPVVLLQRSVVTEEGRSVEHFLVENVEEVAALIGETKAQLPVHANVSMAARADARFEREWFKPLQDVASVSTLIDLPPISHFKAWHAQGGFTVDYCVLNLKGTEVEYSAFVCKPNLPRASSFVTICSSIVASALVYYVSSFEQLNQTFRQSSDFLSEEAGHLQITMGHLMREEVCFDFDAGPGASSIGNVDQTTEE